MSLDRTRLERVVELGDGLHRARCPACAEAGGDRKGQHLRLYRDGKFGCCVHPGDKEHRARIFALAGDHRPKSIKVRTESAREFGARQIELPGWLTSQSAKPDGTDGVAQVELPETRHQQERTARTGELELKEDLLDQNRTLRTTQYSLYIAKEQNVSVLKGFSGPVRDVRFEKGRLPCLTAAGDLVIPFDSPARYHWWDGGQSVTETRAELQERMKEEGNGTPY